MTDALLLRRMVDDPELKEFSLIVIDEFHERNFCLLYTSDAADERSSVDLGGRRIIKKKKTNENRGCDG